MTRRTKIGLGLVGVVAIAGAATLSRGGAETDALPTVEVTTGDLVDKALAVGRIEPEIEVEVKSKVSGVVRRRFADVGDFVRAGDPLLEIRPDPTPLERVDARRQVELRRIEAESQAREIERKRALREQGLISAQEFEAAERSWKEAALQVRIAEERMSLLEQGRITGGGGAVETVVRAPISGYILEKMVEVGDPVVPLSTYMEGTVLMTMADMKELIFRGTVDEIDVGRLREGMGAEIKVGALPEAAIRGTLTRISPKARQEEGSTATVFPIEVRLEETGAATLRAGYSASADVVIDRRERVLVVPERVVTFEGDSAWVMVARPDGTAERRAIATGLSDAISIEVVGGLEAGEKVQEKAQKEIKG